MKPKELKLKLSTAPLPPNISCACRMAKEAAIEVQYFQHHF
jgi:hypothetical protein